MATVWLVVALALLLDFATTFIVTWLSGNDDIGIVCGLLAFAFVGLVWRAVSEARGTL